MQEFIDKLIGRLEELQGVFIASNCVNKADAVCESIRIANELAEQHNNGWIPCSERLPSKEEYLEHDGRFIVTDGNRVYQSIYDIYFHHCFRTLKLFNFGAGDKASYEVDECVIAWQPLPPAYKEGGV